MVQFKDYFQGVARPPYPRVTTAQKCVRLGGKHNDLENVGRTARHHTFFEMLGNFSFGDYGKKEAIHFAWQFLTKELGISKDKLRVTVHEKDEESFNIWNKLEGVPVDRIIKGQEDNFWSMGHGAGPCGPCSEIFYDQEVPDSDGDRWLEIWNLVFMQYYRNEEGQLTNLNKLSIDTGMGLERLCSVLQGKKNNFDNDLFQYLIENIKSTIQRQHKNINLSNSSESPQITLSLRVIADHLRAASFLIADGVLPTNVGRGYVLRRIIRRAVRYLHILGVEDPILAKFVPYLITSMGDTYNELQLRNDIICSILTQEESSFIRTLHSGLKFLQPYIQPQQQTTESNNVHEIPADIVFKLYDTYGFPFDLVNNIAEESNRKIDFNQVNKYMDIQKSKGKSAWKGSGDIVIPNGVKSWVSKDIKTKFTGYSTMKEDNSIIKAIYQEQEESPNTIWMAIDPCPFYPTSGGQISDIGIISFNNGKTLKVVDCVKINDSITAIRIEDSQDTIEGLGILGYLVENNTVTAIVDSNFRNSCKANHTATHLLHHAIRNVLGNNVTQAGSLVTPEKLRFDFTYPSPLTNEQISNIEQIVNKAIQNDIKLSTEELSYEEAIKTDAVHLFNEKYGDAVRVVSIPDHSKEFCGGTHVSNTNEIQGFKILSEKSIATGTRRIEAVTQKHAFNWYSNQYQMLAKVCQLLDVQTGQLDKKVEKLLFQIKSLENDLESAANSNTSNNSVILSTTFQQIPLSLHIAHNLNDSKLLRKQIENVTEKSPDFIHILVSSDRIVLSVNKKHTNIKANEVLQAISQYIPLQGGGSPAVAQGTIKNANDIVKQFQQLPILK